ncbi:hypothetical protein [Streptomyces sp. NPDC056188]|uniref:hypothetical protein n=1 Tax=Streptomyces sp. NPDC056188 TaxID=3345740 RepID=UPI0035D62D16
MAEAEPTIVEAVAEAEPSIVEAVAEAEPSIVEAVVETEPTIAEAPPVVAEAPAGGRMSVHGRGCCCGRAGYADRSAAGHQNDG